ncbi:MAG: sulfur carrier protein ThiS [Vicinamibacteria bacterium]
MSDDAGAIGITVNGTASSCPAGLTVEGLLRNLGLPLARVAVERNREIVRRDLREAVLVQPGDVFEIVTFVGGG